MLSHISLKNFAIVEQFSLDLEKGMTALTGETGAGKSLIIDALDLALGGRGNSGVIRHGTERADITAVFNLENIPAASLWLDHNEFEPCADEVLLRRIIHKEGRSRHFINGQICSQSQMRDLGELLLNIHGQHEHQNLLKAEKQRDILDRYAKHDKLVKQVKDDYERWSITKRELDKSLKSPSEQSAKLELLEYQVKELQALMLEENEVVSLEQEHKKLAHSEEIRDNIQTALNCISENDEQNISSLINLAESELKHILHIAPQLKSSLEMLNTANIQIQEVTAELGDSLEHFESDPKRLFEIDQRLKVIHDLARKHRIEPEQLRETQALLEQDLERLQNTDAYIAKLQKDIIEHEQQYMNSAKKLTSSRKKMATQLNKLVSDSMQQLGMKGGSFKINFETNSEISSYGAEQIEFHVTANPGQPLQAFSKVASGGEISRISLALQMMTAQKNDTPTLIFDEVDVGIGGGTAEVVGKLLRQLGEKAQVLCITHLPQVASQAHHHLQVQKQTKNKQTSTSIVSLEPQPRIEEIARMLGGVKVSQQTLNHAKEMLAQASSST